MRHLGDITKISGHEAPVVDVVIGGSPCQDLSIAGKRAGLAGERSGLYMEQIRIIKEMREADVLRGKSGVDVRPRYMVWENVPGAFSSNGGQDFAAVVEEAIRVADPEAPAVPVPEKGWPTSGVYADERGRWSVAWRVLDAQFWGVPQRRRRIALVADFGGLSAPEVLFVRKSVSGNLEAGEQKRKEAAGAAGDGAAGASYAIQGSMIGRSDKNGPQGDGINEDVSFTLNTTDRHAVSYGIGSYHSNAWKSDNPHSGIYEADTAKTLDALNCGYPACNHGGMAIVESVGFDAYQHHGWRQNDKCGTLTAWQNDSVRGDTPLVCEPVVGFAAGGFGCYEQARSIGYAEEQAPTLNAECGGNKPAVIAFAQNQREEVRNVGEKAVSLAAEVGMHCQTFVALDMSHACDVIRDCGEIVPSLQARMGTGGNQVPLTYQQTTGTLSPGAHAGSYNGQDAYNDAYLEDAETYQVQNMVVRRLTPMECERLQGFPDGWTDIGEWRDSKGKLRKPSDSPRYKALGNSIALPFWDFLAKRISAQYIRPVTMGSLFDGIGGFPLVFERHNGKGTARWASEIEEFPIAVTKLRFGGEDNGSQEVLLAEAEA